MSSDQNWVIIAVEEVNEVSVYYIHFNTREQIADIFYDETNLLTTHDAHAQKKSWFFLGLYSERLGLGSHAGGQWVFFLGGGVSLPPLAPPLDTPMLPKCMIIDDQPNIIIMSIAQS